jgi:ABC-type multidrug transport system ATPase subunit
MSHTHTVEVMCPPGAQPGALLKILTLSGMEIQFQVPQGTSPGQTFPVQYMGAAPVNQYPSSQSSQYSQEPEQPPATATVMDPVDQRSQREMRESGLLEDETQFQGLGHKAETISFSFKNLGLVVKSHDGGSLKVLKGVTGNIQARQLVAVMGPSGAGKTTFMNVLAGRAFYGRTEGAVEINGRRGKILDYRNQVGFVPQDDIVHDDLTVLENLQYSSKLRLPSSLTNKTRNAIVKDVVKLLQVDHIKDSIVGSVEKRGISGGQRKRVNIGLELCADPIVLFLDEPTSGLDSTSSEVVLGALKDLTDLGLTVVTVIHQPRFSIFTRFDHVLLLGKGGRTVYSGPSKFALPYFQNLGFACPSSENPADFLMDTISGQITRKKAGTPMFEPSQLFDFWNDNSRGQGGKPMPNAGAAIFADLGNTTMAVSLKKTALFTPAEQFHASTLFQKLNESGKGLNSTQIRTMVRVLEIVIDDNHFEKLMKVSSQNLQQLMMAHETQEANEQTGKRKAKQNRQREAATDIFRPKQKRMLTQWLNRTQANKLSARNGGTLRQDEIMGYLLTEEMQEPNERRAMSSPMRVGAESHQQVSRLSATTAYMYIY